ncbi:MAG TPA: M28 family metallopeptidase [Candidatus Acidoferrum sp.]|nr:M28 family metallopeptidase [Candidatus Acidoferrum sp.]
MKRMAIAAGVGVWLGIFCGAEARGQKPPLLPEKDVAALANEVSGETAKRNLEGIARFHRQRGSRGFHEAAELVAERLRAYGLSDVAILEFPADGKIFYGTQRSRPAWDAESAELWELGLKLVRYENTVTENGGTSADDFEFRNKLLSSYEAEPVVLAEDSESADVTADLVDVGEGTKESDYAGKDVKGMIVLVGAQPGAVQDLAVGKFGAAGIVSYAQNQKTAWWGEDENLIRWGHLDTFSENKTFAFMVSLKTARRFKERLARGEKIILQAHVKAGQHAGNYEVVTATIPGADAKLKEEEIAFSCHLDHQRPGANDNASGCAAILEVARTLQRLIDEKKLERPARTIRFVFPPEIEGTLALLNGKGQYATLSASNEPGKTTIRVADNFLNGPELAKRIKAVIHMDMVGGGPETKAVFHVTRGPMSLPSFVHDVAWAFADWVNEESYKLAATGKAEYPLVAPEGGKEPLRAEYSAYTMGSDHDVYEDSSFGIPAIYLNDWPDRYIHTNFDSAANIDATKLKRAAFIGAASGYFLAKENRRLAAAKGVLANGDPWRQQMLVARKNSLSGREIECAADFNLQYETSSLNELQRFSGSKEEYLRMDGPECPAAELSANGALRYGRKREPKGPLVVFGYDYFAEHAKAAGIATPKLLSYEGLWGGGEEYAYEVLNFADGKRNAQEIRDAVSAEYGPVPVELVVEYLKALEKIGIVVAVK